jgi:hypothetical protein
MNVVDFLSTRLDPAVIEAQRQQIPFPKQIFYYEPNTQLFEWVYKYFSQGLPLSVSLSLKIFRFYFLVPTALGLNSLS